MKLSLKAIATNRINGSVTAFKVYPVLNDMLASLTDSGYWFINDDGEKQFAHKGIVRDGLSNPDANYSFDLVMHIKTLSETIRDNAKITIENACRPGGHIYDSLRNGFANGGYAYGLGGHFGGAAKAAFIARNSMFKVKVGDLRSDDKKDLDAAVAELDKHLPAYRRSDKGFGLVDSIEWLGKLNSAHRADCMKYEAIIENLMDALEISTHDELAKFASNLKRSADIIDAARKK